MVDKNSTVILSADSNTSKKDEEFSDLMLRYCYGWKQIFMPWCHDTNWRQSEEDKQLQEELNMLVERLVWRTQPFTLGEAFNKGCSKNEILMERADSKQDQNWACNEEKGRKGEIGKAEKELPRKSARTTVLIAQGIEPTTVSWTSTSSVQGLRRLLKTATPSLNSALVYFLRTCSGRATHPLYCLDCSTVHVLEAVRDELTSIHGAKENSCLYWLA
uniref:Uncharacterized protein n=1 Tax=Timema bartmani TaxID=61472 RepID=A0A7R9I296_9NEOP|nr:unnamed protein product [Timema bartmani]